MNKDVVFNIYGLKYYYIKHITFTHHISFNHLNIFWPSLFLCGNKRSKETKLSAYFNFVASSYSDLGIKIFLKTGVFQICRSAEFIKGQ